MRFSRLWPGVVVLAMTMTWLPGVDAAPDAPSLAQAETKLTDRQEEDVQTLVALVDAAVVDRQRVSETGVAWHNDFLKALESKTYVPFTLTIGPDDLEAIPAIMYIRVVGRAAIGDTSVAQPGQEAAITEAGGGEVEGDSSMKEHEFEDVHFLEPRSSVGQSFQVTRAFAVPAGEYDVYVALLQHPEQEGSPDPATILVRQPLTVPDYWSDQLATSTLILAERVEPLTAPLSQEQQADQPYTFGSTQIVPVLDPTFDKTDDLSIVFLVYNPLLGDDQTPDVLVEYSFYQQLGGAEEYFNKTNPQAFNGQTLPPQFNLAAGHQLVAGQSVPLGTFPEGDYRLEIKVTDRNAGLLLERNVRFTVLGS